MDYLIVITRTFIFYVLITIIYRFMGKREVGQLGIIDLIVSILIAELVAMSINNRQESIFISIIPIILLTIIQIVLSFFSLKSNKFRAILDGEPSIIIQNGKLNFSEMIKQRYNLDDLLTQLRDKNIKTIEDVDFAVLETNGTLSVFKKYENREGEYPLPIIIEGIINYDVLKQIGKTHKWLATFLKSKNLESEDIFYAFYSSNKLYIINKDL